MKRLSAAVLALSLALATGLTSLASPAFAARKRVDCDAVMKELQAGKKPKEVAKDLKISRSSVYRCRKIARKKAQQKKPAAQPSGAPSGASH